MYGQPPESETSVLKNSWSTGPLPATCCDPPPTAVQSHPDLVIPPGCMASITCQQSPDPLLGLPSAHSLSPAFLSRLKPRSYRTPHSQRHSVSSASEHRCARVAQTRNHSSAVCYLLRCLCIFLCSLWLLTAQTLHSPARLCWSLEALSLAPDVSSTFFPPGSSQPCL